MTEGQAQRGRQDAETSGKGRGAKPIIAAFLCLGACLVGLAVAHIQLRQEVAGLRRSVHLAILAGSTTPDVPAKMKRAIEDLESELREVKYRLDGLHSKADADSLENLRREVASLEIGLGGVQSEVEDLPDSLDIVQRFELDREIMALEDRVESIEKAIGRRY